MPRQYVDVVEHIDAPAEAVFDRINELGRFNDWNPFPTMDPTTVTSNEGPTSGVGSVFLYEGKRLGKGRMEITGTERPSRLNVAMTFWTPKPSTSDVVFSITPAAAGGVDVHWIVSGEVNVRTWIMGKLFLDKMLANTFLTGLGTLKTLVESEIA
ncbi:MAG: hypothetical protein ABT08_00775 [Microbacterium sp. SCN 71-21]|uniref:SRPBCC family protein n=1 Tax=Microbacterium sp. SCN 71-21 TaxID=1660116 RepID=UPI00086F3AB2|nr:SRPBCC family protein [Microbacterium sp. SCN 71-21]ODU79661.1 MAG: hypothetical protein ABT08_00775 [Microbacterium sp. SCN 71-21]